MSRLHGNLLQSSGKRFHFALNSAPGIITPQAAVVQLFGQVPIAVQPLSVSRTPAPATLVMAGLSLAAPVVLQPATAALVTAGQIPAEQRIRIISPSLPSPSQSPPVDYAPTLITIWTTQPQAAQVTLLPLEINVTQGGNIGFVSPASAQVALQTRQYTLLVLAGGVGLGALEMRGLVPTLQGAATVTPDVGLMVFQALDPRLSLPFRWVDDRPASSSTWITDAAA